MTVQAYFDEEGEWVESSRMVGLDDDGEPVDKVASTLGVGQEIEESTPEALSQNLMSAVYHLTDADVDPKLREGLDAGTIYKFSFNYRADYSAETAFLLSNEHGVFALITKDATPQWCQLASVARDDFAEEEEMGDDLDFEMF